jgi:hypothetical protein
MGRRERRGTLAGHGYRLGGLDPFGELDADDLDGAFEDRLHRPGQRSGGTSAEDGEAGHGRSQPQAQPPALQPIDQRPT